MTDAVKKNGINFGVTLAVILVLLNIVMYLVDLELFVNSALGFVRMFIIITLAILAVVQAKKALGGFINFKEAFTAFFITILIGLVAYTLSIIILFNVIDPQAKATLNEMYLRLALETMQNFTDDTKMLREVAEQQKGTDNLGIGTQLLGLAISIVGYSVVGLIVAAILKSKAKTEY